MKLRCKKTYYMLDTLTRVKFPRISEDVYYQVLEKQTRDDGTRYWCFLIPEEINPNGSGWFDIDEWFETPEEARDIKINNVLNTQLL